MEPAPQTSDMPTFKVDAARLKEVLRFLKTEARPKFRRLEDLTAVDESARRDRENYPDFTLVYHLLSYETASRVRLKVDLHGQDPEPETITDIWPAANWYEREVFDMFGIRFRGHPDLRRLLMPHDWEGHPLRKSYPDRATAMAPYTQDDARRIQPLDAGHLPQKTGGRRGVNPERGSPSPEHPRPDAVYGLSLRGEEITDIDMDIGYHHRGAEKIGERQSWHQFIPYTDRVDYLSGVANNLSYLTAVETLTGIKVPDRAQFIRVMLTEFFRISNHLVCLCHLRP